MITVLCSLALLAAANGPWHIHPKAADPSTPASLRRVLPGVHSVAATADSVTIESAGLSLTSFGPIETGGGSIGPRQFKITLPAQPKRAKVSPLAPLGVIGILVNGVPLHNPTSAASFNNQNIWHRDAVRDAAGTPATAAQSRIIGYALDGYPIYNFTAGATSSYRLRHITERTVLPDGTQLTPGQYGPPVDAEFPLGTFVEDYEYVAGHGTLDEHNGREQGGQYGYYLSSYPYTVGPTLRGELPGLAQEPSQLTYAVRNAQGQPVRHLEYVHDKPLHLILVSDDLEDFFHVHPTLGADHAFHWSQPFPRATTYHAFAQYTPPGKGEQLEHTTLKIAKAEPVDQPRTTLDVRLDRPDVLFAGRDYTFTFHLPVDDLEPYLGAWGHFIFIDSQKREFIHAHPFSGPEGKHNHSKPMGPSPRTLKIQTGFSRPGRYRLWAQFQHLGQEVIVPYWLDVSPAVDSVRPSLVTKKIEVTPRGFEPSEFRALADQPASLMFLRTSPGGCGSRVVFPDLGISRDLPLNQAVSVELPPLAAGTYRFTCGMGMYKGAVLAKP
jgi:hypothetical protein